MKGSTAAGCALISVVHFVFVALGAAVLSAPLIALMAFSFWRLMQPGEMGAPGFKAVTGVTLAGTTLGTAAAWLAAVPAASNPWAWAGVPLSAALAAAIYSLGAASRTEPCLHCGKSAQDDRAATCPRCRDRVCRRPSCWNAKLMRCVRCETRKIVLFPMAEQWWRLRFGRTSTRGPCWYCLKESMEAALYDCGKCGWPLCATCWDHHNGVCPRCQWTIPNATVPAGVPAGADRGPRKAAPSPARAAGAEAAPRQPAPSRPRRPPPPPPARPH